MSAVADVQKAGVGQVAECSGRSGSGFWKSSCSIRRRLHVAFMIIPIIKNAIFRW